MRNPKSAVLHPVLLSIAWLAVISAPVMAQDFATNPPNSSGPGVSSPIGQNSLSQIESIDPVSGALSLSIPVAQLPPGSGGFSAGLNLIYNSSIYDIVQSFPFVYTDDQFVYTPSSHGGGWSYGYQYTLWAQPRIAISSGFDPNSSQCSAISPGELGTWFKSFITTPDGGNHVLALLGTVDSGGTQVLPYLDPNGDAYTQWDFSGNPNPYCNAGGTSSPFAGSKLIFATSDGSYIRVEADTSTQSWIAYLPDGTRVSGPIVTLNNLAIQSDASLITDRNGNTLTLSGTCGEGQSCQEDLTDQFGRQIAIHYGSSLAGNWQDTINWTGYSGASLTTNVTWGNYCLGSTGGSNPSSCTEEEVAPNYCYATNWQTGATACTSPYAPYPLSGTSVPAVTTVQLPASSETFDATTYVFGYYYAPLPQQGTGPLSWGEVHSIGMCTGGCQSGLQPGQLQPLCAYGAISCAQWDVAYTYLFDQVSVSSFLSTTPRPPGTTLNPVATRTLTYNELLDGSSATPISEPTSYNYSFYQGSGAGGTSVFNYPTTGVTTITYPDMSTSSISTVAVASCGSSRDFCPAVPYKTVNRDGSYVLSGWTWPANSLSLPFNPYAQYSVSYPTAAGSPPSATYTQQDQDGNVTAFQEYNWLSGPPTILNDLVTALPSATPVRTTNMNYAWSSQSSPYPYWDERSASVTYLRARSCMSIVALMGTSCAQTGNNVYETYTYDNSLTTANLTTRTQFDSGSGQTISSSWTYNSNGNVASSTAPNGNVTNITYDSNALYPTQVVTAATSSIKRTFGFSYDFNSGLTNSVTDVDNSIQIGYTYDNLGRQGSAKETATLGTGPPSRSVATTYDDINLGVTVTTPNTTTTTYYDALGRVRYQVNPNAGINVQKAYRYGTNGSYELTSNPYTSVNDLTMGWTLTTRDAVGRVIEVDAYGGQSKPGLWGNNGSLTGKTTTAYLGTSSPCTGFNVQVTDETLNTHINCLDGLGRLSSVQEPQTPSTTSPVITSYSYDPLNNLSGVSSAIGGATGQSYSGCSGGLVRCFVYSTLSRLTSATNPESGTTAYAYNPTSNILTRTDADINVATTTYDQLNRPTGIAYSGPYYTPNVTYTYDHDFHGALSSVAQSSPGSSTAYTHDGFGRISTSTQTTNSIPYTFTYGYSPTDQLTSITYPSGRQVSYSLDAADRVTAVNGLMAGQPTSYASNINYTAASGFSSMTTGNIVNSAFTWSTRFQPTGITVNNTTEQILGLSLTPCPYTTTAPSCSGNLQSQTITAPSLGPLTQTYTYDGLSRLTGASENSGAWSENYGYDGFGNRWVSNHSSSLPSLTLETPQAASSYSNSAVPNWINGFTYDLAGNVRSIYMGTNASRNFTYDAENRQVSATIVTPGSTTVNTYAYDGNGLRVSNTPTGGSATVYVYDAFGNLAAEYGPSEPSPCVTSSTCYVTTDHLGSTRMLTDTSGTAQRRYDYLPFGTEIPAGVDGRSTGYQTSPDDVNPKFTGQMRDQETSNDWFNVRHMSGAQGRFQSPDPMNFGAVAANPQSWNGYAYVVNNPTSYTDPTGLYCSYQQGGYDGTPVGSTVWNTTQTACQNNNGVWIPYTNTTVTVNGDTGDVSYGASIVDESVSGGGSGASASTQHSIFGAPSKPSPCSAPKYGQARSFINTNLGAAQQIASQLNTTLGNILGLSGNESGYGTGFLISAGTNNYFSLTAGPAFGGTIGTYQHGSYTYGVYSSFLASGQSFANSYFGARVNGITNPSAFAQALNANGSFNSENLANPYAQSIANTINLVNTLIPCSQ